MEIYGNQAVIDTITEYHKKGDRTIESLKCAPLRLMEPGDTIQSGDITATALKATHAPTETALNYIIQRNGKTILIANDTGWFPDQSWDLLKNFSFDAVILDCCYMHWDQRRSHMGGSSFTECFKELEKQGSLKPGARLIANHFSHNPNLTHEELCTWLNPLGIEVGYDGMEIEL
jgi:phosphoribosyl 1,2-cyclic phosphate phosphodiesterase